jgi:hypothetical protein
LQFASFSPRVTCRGNKQLKLAWHLVPDTVLYPPNPCQVVAHGASPNGIVTFELSINNTVAASIPNSDSQKTLATWNYECSHLQPGKNLLELRVQDKSGVWSEYTETTVILASQDIGLTVTETLTPRATEPSVSAMTATLTPPLTPTFTAIPTLTPTLAPTFTPTFTATPQPTGSVTIERVSANLVYLGRADCGPLDVTITARATAPKGIKLVILFYRFETGSSSSGFESVGMNPIGGDLYERSLNPTSLLGGSVPFDQATLQYQIVIQQNDGDTSLRTPVHADIAVQACGSVSSVCSTHLDERTCIANGCTWGPIPGTRQIGCQDP